MRLAMLALGLLAAATAGAVVHRRASRLATTTAPAEEATTHIEDEQRPVEPLPPAREKRTVAAAPRPDPPPSPAPRDARSAAPERVSPREAEESPEEKRRELEAAMRRVSIRLYTTAWCPRCTEAKAWLAAHRQSYTEYDVEKSDENRRAQRALNPRGGVPTIDVEGEVLVGFSGASLQGAIRRAAQRRVR